MHVNPLGNGPVAGTAGAQGQDKARGPQDEAAPSSGDIIQPGPGANGNANGVMRLLQEGHFQGVSGLRLQINFHEQLSGIAQQSVASTADAGADSILAAIDTVVADFTANPELDATILEGITTAQQTFNEAATALFEEFQSGAIGDADLLASLQTAFEDFIASIESVIPAGVTETSEGDPVAATSANVVEIDGVIPTGGEILPVDTTEGVTEEPPDAAGPDFAAFIQSLGDAFSGALADLEVALASAESTVPEISAPNGNGVAFAKFLAILDALNGDGSSGPAATTAPETEIDTAV